MLCNESMPKTTHNTAGSGGMLLLAKRTLEAMNEGVQVTLFGQELMPSAFALGKADLLIQGGRPDAIKRGDTLLHDEYENQTFDYVLSNPPFGMDWGVQEKEVSAQAKIPGGRFSHGLPPKNDGQMLFLAHCASKLSPAGKNGHGGRAAVVSNASPLFASGAGATSIRQWLFDEDLIDAIIALPTQMFYGTGIATYVWILDTNKDDERRGKIQLIDATSHWSPMRKPLGEKRREMSKGVRQTILDAYRDFTNSDISKILTPQDFMFRDVPVFKQARFATKFTDEVVEALQSRKDFTTEHLDILRSLDGTPWNDLSKAIPAAAKKIDLKAPAGLVDAAMNAMAVEDPDAPPAVNRKGEPVIDPSWKITERIPYSVDLEDHMRTEVLPFAPDAQWDETKTKDGNEIPFTRIFYVPEEPRPLEEIDADVQRIMGELMDMFAEVKVDEA